MQENIKIDIGIMSIFKMMKNIKKLYFKSQSLSNSHMEWNYMGIGTVELTLDYNKLYFSEEIILDNNARYTDKKMWYFHDSFIEFYHYRNEKYEKIFEFSVKNNKFVLKEKYECQPDVYYGALSVLEYKVFFTMNIRGMRKDELLEYIYLPNEGMGSLSEEN